MKKIWLIIVFVSFLFTLAACNPEEDTEIPDFSTYIEVQVETTIMNQVYMIEEIILSSENSIYLVIDQDIYKGTFMAIEEGNSLFTIKTEIDPYYWIEVLQDDLIKCYYK